MIYLEKVFRAMACPNVIQLYVEHDVEGRQAMQRAVDEVLRIEAKYSRYREDSLLSRINASAGGEAVAIDDETAGLMRHAAACYDISGGLFDITSGVLRRAWDFSKNVPPSPASIARLLPLIDWPHVEFDEHSVRLPRKEMQIDFGGIGKEYAADRAAAVLLASGIESGLVSLGGDVRVLGPRPDGSGWPIHIAHPRKPGGILGTFPLSRGATATSGDYMRCFDFEGQRYCHVLNPLTGQPTRTWQSASVISAICIDAGSITTMAMLMERDAPALLQRRNENALLVDQAGIVHRYGLFRDIALVESEIGIADATSEPHGSQSRT